MMENKYPVPVELNDEELGSVSGGVMSGPAYRGNCTNTANVNGEVCSSGFEGLNFPVGAISEE